MIDLDALENEIKEKRDYDGSRCHSYCIGNSLLPCT